MRQEKVIIKIALLLMVTTIAIYLMYVPIGDIPILKDLFPFLANQTGWFVLSDFIPVLFPLITIAIFSTLLVLMYNKK